MAGSSSPTGGPGSFIPTTNIWDPSELYSIEVTSPEFKELMVRLYQNLNNMSLSMNTRDAGFYALTEFVNGQVWFPDPNLSSQTQRTPTLRQDFRKVYNLGPLVGGIIATAPLDITLTSTTTFTRIYGVANDTTNQIYYCLPFIDPIGAVDNIVLSVSGGNVTVTATGAPYPNINQIYVVLEYLKS